MASNWEFNTTYTSSTTSGHVTTRSRYVNHSILGKYRHFDKYGYSSRLRSIARARNRLAEAKRKYDLDIDMKTVPTLSYYGIRTEVYQLKDRDCKKITSDIFKELKKHNLKRCQRCGHFEPCEIITYLDSKEYSISMCKACQTDFKKCLHCDNTIRKASYRNGKLVHGGEICSACKVKLKLCYHCNLYDKEMKTKYDKSICSICELVATFCDSCRTVRFKRDMRGTHCMMCVPKAIPRLKKLHCMPCLELPHRIHTGVEIESEIVSIRANKSKVKEELAKTALVHGDGSLSNGIEIVTPALYGKRLKSTIEKSTDVLKSNGFGIKSTCGLHVHLNASRKTNYQMRKFLRLYMLMEKSFLCMLPKDRHDNYYCKKLRGVIKTADVFKNKPVDHIYYGTSDNASLNRRKSHKYDNLRYYALNIHSYYYRGSVEFRAHEGTLNPEKIINWINILHAFYNYGFSISQSRLIKIRKLKQPARQKLFKKILKDKKLIAYYEQREKAYK